MTLGQYLVKKTKNKIDILNLVVHIYTCIFIGLKEVAITSILHKRVNISTTLLRLGLKANIL